MTARDEQGIAVIWGIASMALLSFVAVVCVHVGSLVSAHRQAQSGADLAALAGAGGLRFGNDPCSAAGLVARRNQAELRQCVVSDLTIGIEVVVEVDGLFGRRHQLRARARAGPSGLTERLSPHVP